MFKSIGNVNAKVFFVLNVIAFILESIDEELDFTQQITTLLAKYPNVDFQAMGFPEDWQELEIWRDYE